MSSSKRHVQPATADRDAKTIDAANWVLVGGGPQKSTILHRLLPLLVLILFGATPALPRILLNIAALISGGIKGVISK